ncbi:MAG: hydrogenase nickel incorporation protein HypB [Methylococcales bacterium]|nr:hydrogenase nickel incorporation protein HypB [Methylococcales bacterium]
MCNTCGCNVTDGNKAAILAEQPENGVTTLSVLSRLTARNDRQATHNRQHFDQHQVLAVNLMSSPGSGKTALLEATIDALAGRWRIAVIEGDLATENDAERIRRRGVSAYQITTGTACHLDAHLIHNAVHHLDLAELDIVFIENVGNLVCPASFDLGHHVNVTLLSVTEGDDKPAKYPVMFRAADMMLISKTDLQPHLPEFNGQRAQNYLRQLGSDAEVLALSAKQGTGLERWLDWLDTQRQRLQQRLAQGQTLTPHVANTNLVHAAPAPARQPAPLL